MYIVKKGDTLYSIARSYGIKDTDIMKLNGIKDPQKLQLGQRLKIRIADTPVKAGPVFEEYKVKGGDNLYRIAREKGIRFEDLCSANGFRQDRLLKIGEVIKIPRAGASGEQAGPAGGQKPAVNTDSPAEAAKAGSDATPPRSTAVKTVDPSLSWPVNVKEVSYMTGKLYGVMLSGEHYEPVKSLSRGTVVSAGPYRGFGKVVIVQMSGGYLYVYGGCERLSVKEGDRVVSGTELGSLGIDAVSQKPKLFFLVYRNSTPIDPAKAPRS
ncbi:MAG: M23 family metallopeptidase [Treponema sp.]|nr:M23 family metallopeptidase [Treponema sp.]